MIKKKPALYVSYRENGKETRLGPFFTACPDGYLAGEWITYKVQTEKLNFTRITVPWHHTLMGMVEKEETE